MNSSALSWEECLTQVGITFAHLFFIVYIRCPQFNLPSTDSWMFYSKQWLKTAKLSALWHSLEESVASLKIYLLESCGNWTFPQAGETPICYDGRLNIQSHLYWLWIVPTVHIIFKYTSMMMRKINWVNWHTSHIMQWLKERCQTTGIKWANVCGCLAVAIKILGLVSCVSLHTLKPEIKTR